MREASDMLESQVTRPWRLLQRILGRPHAVFFYPAGLYDWEPLRYFAEFCDTFIYCDLAIHHDVFDAQSAQGLQRIESLSDVQQSEEIWIDGDTVGVTLRLGIDDQPWLQNYLSPGYTQDYNAAVNTIRTLGGPWGRQFGVKVSGKHVVVYCFRAEAFRCYAALFTEHNVAPKIVCLKNSLGLRRLLDMDRWCSPLGRAVADSPQPELVITDLPRHAESDWPWNKKWKEYTQWGAVAYSRQHPVTSCSTSTL